MGSNEHIVGQPRALRSLEIGLSLQKSGYNIFVSGEATSGRHEAVRYCAENQRNNIDAIRDIVYVCNFKQPDSPTALTFRPGEGERFCDACSAFNQDLLSLTQDSDHFLEKAERLVDQLEQQFPENRQLSTYFAHLKADLAREAIHIQHLDAEMLKSAPPIARKYQANLLVNHAQTRQRPPLIIESYPTFDNLFGSVDSDEKIPPHLSLHAGSLLEAAGGFIVIEAEKLLGESGLWEALKRYLDANALAYEAGGLVTKGGELKSKMIRPPQVVPLPIKVILIGSEEVYDMLCDEDERFLTLFKICAQFDYSMELSKEAIARASGLWMPMQRTIT